LLERVDPGGGDRPLLEQPLSEDPHSREPLSGDSVDVGGADRRREAE
jgi:hypothetical protein